MPSKKPRKTQKPGKITTMPVSERALVQRINRKYQSLAEDGTHHYALELRKTKGGRAKVEFGDFYLVNTEYNGIDEHHVNIEALGRELKVLADYEHLHEGRKS